MWVWNLECDVRYVATCLVGKYVQGVLYGIFPMILAGALLMYSYMWYKNRAIAKFKDPNVLNLKLKKIHRFESPSTVYMFLDTASCVNGTCAALLGCYIMHKGDGS